ncbi:MAG: hypothetical protein M1819_004998 [Sarea resinae]|nr:MAG: hypothetical protein M1819_004998 [Sarea resinae]
MHFFKTLLLGATALAGLVSAQQASLQLTSFPKSVTAGSPSTLTWTGGDASSPVTITLRKGNPLDLQTVSVLTDSAIGGSYIWTPSSSLPSASDYAFMITQGSAVNYGGPVALTGSSLVSSSANSTATSTSSNSTITSAPAFTGTAISASASGSSFTTNGTVSIATLKPSASSLYVSATGSSGSIPTTAPSSGAAGIASPIALVLSAVVALCYLN